MNNPLSLTSLRTKLLRRGLSRDYVERVIAEWSNHQEDAVADTQVSHGDDPLAGEIASVQLGSEAALLASTVTEYRRRFFAGRHPVWTFLVAPWPALFLAWAAYLFTVALLGDLLDVDEYLSRSVWIVYAVDGVLVFGVPLAVASAFGRLATRSCLGLRWVLASTVLVGLAAFCLKTQIQAPTGGPGTGSYMVGLGIAPGDLLNPAHWLQPLPALAPCLVLVGFAARDVFRHRQLIRNA